MSALAARLLARATPILVARIDDSEDAALATEAGAGGLMVRRWQGPVPHGILVMTAADDGVDIRFLAPGDDQAGPPRSGERFAHIETPACDPAALAAAGFVGVLLDTGRARLLDVVPYAALRELAETARQTGLALGFAGALEAADVPRLAPLRPAFLVFDAALRDGEGRFDPAACRALAALAQPPAATTPALRGEPDRVFIRDFVQEMEIGAYGSEHGRRQRVRFSLEGEMAPASPGPRSLADIYSYDRMMDAVRALVAREHEALVETLAERLAGELLEDPRLIAVRVRVEKLDLGPGAAGVEIHRRRGD